MEHRAPRRQSRTAVVNASQAARASRSLVDRIGSIERLAQQIALLDDPEIAPTTRACTTASSSSPTRSRSCRSTLRSRLRSPAPSSRNRAFNGRLTEFPRAQLAAGQITEHVDRLSDSAREVLAISNLLVDREVERLRFNAEHVQRSLILLVIFSTAVALTIALALTRYISRPIAGDRRRESASSAARISRADLGARPEDLRYLGRRLDWLRRRLDEFETQKNRFLRHVSHELKTPLTALREGAELLHDEVCRGARAGAAAGGRDHARQTASSCSA